MVERTFLRMYSLRTITKNTKVYVLQKCYLLYYISDDHCIGMIKQIELQHAQMYEKLQSHNLPTLFDRFSYEKYAIGAHLKNAVLINSLLQKFYG